MKKKPFYLSIDFEDIYHDLLRQTGKKNVASREKALLTSYEAIARISKVIFDNKKITFFVTGILARKSPGIIQRIHQDGHEIGCHYNYHDKINETSRSDFIKNLDQAIESIQNVIGEKPKGFRAPVFAIDEKNTWVYEELAKRFEYDSSFKTSVPLEQFKNKSKIIHNGHHLNEFFIYEMPLLKGKFKIRTGGSFLRLFPFFLLKKAMSETYDKGHIPIIYLHPYDITVNKEFWLSWKDLEHLKFKKRIILFIRQRQWMKLGNTTVYNKLKKISQLFDHQGLMQSHKFY